MASNALSYNDLALGYGVPNRLLANGDFATPTTDAMATATSQSALGSAPTNYPSWLTDLSARGLASDWAPAARVTPDPQVLIPRDIPPDEPAAQPLAAPMAQADPVQPGLNGGGPDGGDGGEGGGETGSGASGDTGADSGSGGGGADSFFSGGIVTRNRLAGPNPPGPDDGYASLNAGEAVLTAAAVRHYGPAFVAKLNRLAIPRKAA